MPKFTVKTTNLSKNISQSGSNLQIFTDNLQIFRDKYSPNQCQNSKIHPDLPGQNEKVCAVLAKVCACNGCILVLNQPKSTVKNKNLPGKEQEFTGEKQIPRPRNNQKEIPNHRQIQPKNNKKEFKRNQENQVSFIVNLVLTQVKQRVLPCVQQAQIPGNLHQIQLQ